MPLGKQTHIHFADANALKGTLLQYLLEVRPHIFFAVPRIYEKIEERLRKALDEKPTIQSWTRAAGTAGTQAQLEGKSTGIKFKIFNKLVIQKIKEKIGLDQTFLMVSGAAPLPQRTQEFFFSLNMLIRNTYGMSETSGPTGKLYDNELHTFNPRSVGRPLNGVFAKITDRGEACYFGRNIFMGYLKNEEATLSTIDDERYIHSGDVGEFDKQGNLLITGRIKEILMTAGGENVAPIVIEEFVKKELPFVSQAMLVGDQKKFISCLLSFKVDSDTSVLPSDKLHPEAIEELEKLGLKGIKTVQEAMASPELKELTEQGIQRANKKVVSRAAQVKKWAFIEKDFSIPGGELTPTMKIRRPNVLKNNADVINKIYGEESL